MIEPGSKAAFDLGQDEVWKAAGGREDILFCFYCF